MCQVSWGEISLLDALIDLLVDGVEGALEWGVD
jgi:hypothetical protein